MFTCTLADYSKAYSSLAAWPGGHMAAAEGHVLHKGVAS